MSRRFTLAFLFTGAALLLAPAAAPKDKTAAVVKVDCAEGESINSASRKTPARRASSSRSAASATRTCW